jgi:predicted Zn-dependent peptidase
MLAALLVPALSAPAQDRPRPAVGPARPFSPAARAERDLPNGLHIVVARHGSVPKVAATLVASGAGLAADPAGRVGLASLTAQSMLDGTSTRSSEQIRREAFGMGGSVTSSAGQDFATIEVSGLAEFMPRLLDLLGDVAMNPTFPAEEVASLKTRTLQQIEQQNASPQFVGNREFRRALFQQHPYARVSARPDDVKEMDRGAFAAFHGARWRPNRATLIVVGDVVPEDVFVAAMKAFGRWERLDAAATTMPPVPPLEGRRLVFVQRPGSVQSSMSVGNPAVKRTDPRWYAFTVANGLFGGSFNSRLVRTLREQKGYTYSPYAQFAAFADAGFTRIVADVRNEVTGAALADTYAEVDKLRAEGPAPQELEDIKQYLRGLFVIRMADQGQLASDLVSTYVYGLPRDYLETYQPKISAVTADEVKSASATLLGSSDSLVVVVGDWPQVKSQLADFKEITFLDVAGTKLEAPPAAN